MEKAVVRILLFSSFSVVRAFEVIWRARKQGACRPRRLCFHSIFSHACKSLKGDKPRRLPSHAFQSTKVHLHCGVLCSRSLSACEQRFLFALWGILIHACTVRIFHFRRRALTDQALKVETRESPVAPTDTITCNIANVTPVCWWEFLGVYLTCRCAPFTCDTRILHGHISRRFC